MSVDSPSAFAGIVWEPPVLRDGRVGAFVPDADRLPSFVPALLPVAVDRSRVNPALASAANALSDLARCCRARAADGPSIRRAVNGIAPVALARDGLGSKPTEQAWRDRRQEERIADQAIAEALALPRLTQESLTGLHAVLCASTPAALTAWVQPGRIRTMPAFMVTDQEEIAMVFAPAGDLGPLLRNLIAFIEWEAPTAEDMLLQAAMVHQQITMIHAFADGNGRIARLASEYVVLRFFSNIKLFPMEKIFNENRNEYCKLQLNVIINGFWEEWICFFSQSIEKLSILIQKNLELL